MALNKENVKKHLEERQAQLSALIEPIKSQGKKHPQYQQLATLEEEKRIVDNQLSRLQKLM